MKVVEIKKYGGPEVLYIGNRSIPEPKINEILISSDESYNTYEYKDFYVINSLYTKLGKKYKNNNGKKMKSGFIYSSDKNENFLDRQKIKNFLFKKI